MYKNSRIFQFSETPVSKEDYITSDQFIDNFVGEVADSVSDDTNREEDIQWLLYPFAFILQFAISTVVLFIQISLYAYIGLITLRVFKRRGEYRQIWRTTALAITRSTLLSILSSFLPVTQTFINVIGIIITLTLLVIASTKYPRVPQK